MLPVAFAPSVAGCGGRWVDCQAMLSGDGADFTGCFLWVGR